MSREKRNKLLGLICSQAQGMLNLLGDLLDISKIEAGKVELHPESTVLATYVEEMRERNRLLAEKKKITLTTDVAPGLPAVAFDENRIGQVLNNLLTNAFKYSPINTSVVLRVCAISGSVVFSVLDQGQGIPPDEFPKLFGAFDGPARSRRPERTARAWGYASPGKSSSARRQDRRGK